MYLNIHCVCGKESGKKLTKKVFIYVFIWQLCSLNRKNVKFSLFDSGPIVYCAYTFSIFKKCLQETNLMQNEKDKSMGIGWKLRWHLKNFSMYFFGQYLHNNMNIDTRAKNANKNSLSVLFESTSLENWLYWDKKNILFMRK